MPDVGVRLPSSPLILTRGRDFKWERENLDENREPVNYDAGSLFFELHTYGQQNALQEVRVIGGTGGTYKFTWSGQTTADIDYYDATSNPHGMNVDITDALVALSNIGPNDVIVHPAALIPVWKLNLTLNAGSNEVQRITLRSDVTGGTFVLSCGANFTSPLTFGVTAADMQTALRGLTSIGSGNCTVTKVTNWEYLVEFIGSKAATNVTQILGWGVGLGFLLTGGLPPGLITTSTIVNGSAKLSEPLTNTLNKTVNDFFDSFETLAGVDIDVAITDALNITLTVTSKKSFVESDIITFAVDATSTALTAFFNGTSTFLGKIDTISVAFWWNHIYQVEFTGVLGLTPQPTLIPDFTDLTGTDAEIEVEVIQVGKPEFTIWTFDITGSMATLKVESEEVAKIVARTPWQLVWLASGEPAGGDPLDLGIVQIQPPR